MFILLVNQLISRVFLQFLIFCYMQNTTSQLEGKGKKIGDLPLADNSIEINVVSPSLLNRPVSFNPSNQAGGHTEGFRSKGSRKTKKMEEEGHPSRIKLRDYLFLAQTSSMKNAQHKRKVHEISHIEQGEENKESSLQRKGEGKESRQDIKKNKYDIDNSEMMGIIKDELFGVLAESMKEIEHIVNNLQHLPKTRSNPTDSEMITMYELRAMAKDRLKRTTQEMKGLLARERSQRRTSETDSLFSERELGRNLTFIKEMFSQKCLQEIQNKLPK